MGVCAFSRLREIQKKCQSEDCDRRNFEGLVDCVAPWMLSAPYLVTSTLDALAVLMVLLHGEESPPHRSKFWFSTEQADDDPFPRERMC